MGGLINVEEKLEVAKNFIEDYPEGNPKLEEAQCRLGCMTAEKE